MLKSLTAALALIGGLAVIISLRFPNPPEPHATELGPGVDTRPDWAEAIAAVQKSHRLLLIYDGWADETRCLACQGLADALRGLIAGEPGYERYAMTLREHFVFLNVQVTSQDEALAPRGPEGPYRYEAKDVPNLVIKRWDGETLIQQRSFYPDRSEALRLLASLIDAALAKNSSASRPAEVG